jgi:hypothetical protein
VKEHTRERLTALVLAAYKKADEHYAEEAAIEWAGPNYTIPKEACLRDTDLFKSCGHDWKKMVAAKRELVDGNRLSVKRIEDNIHPDNPARPHLLILVEGMPDFVTTDPTVTLHNSRDMRSDPTAGPKMRNKYRRVLPAVIAVDKLLYDNFHSHGLAIILSKEDALTHVEDFHLHVASWAEKANAAKGRNTNDGNDCGEGFVPINSPFVKEASILLWEPVYNPTLADIDDMISEFL